VDERHGRNRAREQGVETDNHGREHIVLLSKKEMLAFKRNGIAKIGKTLLFDTIFETSQV
jgi:hypothetical protein